MKLKPDHWRLIRDATLFFVGLFGVIHEAFFTDLDRPGLLVLFASMMGVTAILRGTNGKS